MRGLDHAKPLRKRNAGRIVHDMNTAARSLTVAALAAFTWLAFYMLPIVTHGLMDAPVQDNGRSAYTMFERCHPAQFNIPAGGCEAQ